MILVCVTKHTQKYFDWFWAYNLCKKKYMHILCTLHDVKMWSVIWYWYHNGWDLLIDVFDKNLHLCFKKTSESKRPKPLCGTQKQQFCFGKLRGLWCPNSESFLSLTWQTPKNLAPTRRRIASSSKVAIFARYIASYMGTTGADVNPLSWRLSCLSFSKKNVRFCIFKMANIRKGLCVLPFEARWHLLLTLAQKEIVEGKQQPVDDTRTKESSRVSVIWSVWMCV